MEPEIARRCVSCGAAVRGRAQFCPQCGAGMSEALPLNQPAQRPADKPRTTSGRLVDEAERIAHELNVRVATASEAAAVAIAPGDNKQPAAPQVQAQLETSAPAVLKRERATGMRVRAGERVERMREASFVVLDEAQDDPALRFVLIAIALFVLFLLILLFSHILG